MNSKFLTLIFFLLMFTHTVYSQVGINTEIPTTTLDINGDLRVREVDVSKTTEDNLLVVNSDGVVMKSIVSNSFFRGYLASDFSSATSGGPIFKITNFTVIDQPNQEFSTTTSTFTPTYSGLYNIALALTSTGTDDLSGNNVVFGLVNGTTNKWVMRFSVPTTYITSVGTNSGSGALCSFLGAAQLSKGTSYYFGVTDNIKLISNPSGSTGDGIGSYLAIELLKATSE